SVNDGTNTSDVQATMGVLVGDTNTDGLVDSADITQTKSQSGQPVTQSNFREDINADGFLNSADISFVKSKSGTALQTAQTQIDGSSLGESPRIEALPTLQSQRVQRSR